ncbi:DUF808 domain-containing protein [Lentibacter sp. XHP0401]|jgi:uncharacterized protein|uniref:DUF808 domain-containing protein n=1 Tax=Lentibacter sp. XHP0401 TaxID=2984334 RepID=UPI0021E8B164|nr:DUF808 domain-containing protein [Lentibacter sp. XHP0401]MCV2891945.1 DUF808 domain-containing protein [Lentibacter sp. XHP0401]
MSGLLALLDDVAAIAKVAAASVDDVIGQAAKAGSKAAGAMIDDAAVTPKYVHGFAAERELPVIWRIARGSMINKLVFLLPAGLALSNFAPWAIPPLLMLGGAYLCFEGAEKIAHALGLIEHHHAEGEETHDDPAHLEEERAKGAIKTDFILSAEIMTIALAAIPKSTFWMEAFTLAAVAVMITVAVYGSVALIVKADDVGLHMANNAHFSFTRRLGEGIVKAMPNFLWLLTVVGTAAMLWVGGSIIIHALHELGFHAPYVMIKEMAASLANSIGGAIGALKWVFTATMDGILGLALGLLLVPFGLKVVTPIWQALFRKNV